MMLDGRKRMMYRDEDPTNPPQSKVVHVRNLSPQVIEADLIDSLATFGRIAYATCMPNKQMALVEFEEMESARQCVKVSQENPVEVAGVPALFNYSTSQTIQRGGLERESPNHILALTVANATYPINARVIYRACSFVGTIRRIAVMKRNYIQALVEFDSVETAVEGKKALNGADIYPGCCTVKAEYAKADTVKISRNTLDTWDFVENPEGPPTTMRSDDSPMMAEKDEANFPAAGQQAVQQHDEAYYSNANYDQDSNYGYFNSNARYDDSTYMDRRGSKMARKFPQPTNYEDSVVLMVYGINQEQFDCDRIFNLFCCYGNVIKQDTCMVQMGHEKEANNVLRYLQNAPIFGTQLAVRPSKSNVLHNNTEAFTLPNGSSSFVDFTTSRNHRFSTAASAARNRIVYPTEQLHFFNLPLHYEVPNIEKLFAESGRNGPLPINIVPFHVKMAHSLSGLVTFESPEKALEALMIYNHMPVPDATDDDPPILKLTLSSSGKEDGSSGQY